MKDCSLSKKVIGDHAALPHHFGFFKDSVGVSLTLHQNFVRGLEVQICLDQNEFMLVLI